VLANIEGILNAYEDIRFETLKPAIDAPNDLITLFDRLVNDPGYLEFSDAVSQLAIPERRQSALVKVRELGRKLMSQQVVMKGWNYIGKVIKAWTGAPIPEAESLATVFSGKVFPPIVDLRRAKQRAINSWLSSYHLMSPISTYGHHIDAEIEWLQPDSAQPGIISWSPDKLTQLAENAKNRLTNNESSN
jgi:hypothetical protein